MHARPAMLLAETAQQYNADVSIRRIDQPDAVDAKSIMQLMMLAATTGTELEVKANGPDASNAVEAIAALVNTGFHEE
jgi:phosphotransferase system HPr (HPr) family protein